ncbi:MAG: DNA-3-methyladenine glycosylase family protein [Chloroflexota bacterium]
MQEAAGWLAEREPALRRVLDQYGLPPFWNRPPGFASLVYNILEQQVSLASAKAAFDRLNAALPELSPAAFLALDDDTLLRIGFSRQKRGYCRGLAQAILDGTLDLQAVHAADDDTARAALVRLKGIGAWTADIYLLLSLLRPDVLPVQDLGLIGGVRRAWGLSAAPSRAALLEMAENWRPFRSAATRLAWHCYLSRPAG